MPALEKALGGEEMANELFCGGTGTLGDTCRPIQAGPGRMTRTNLQTFQLPKVEPTSKSPNPHVPSSPKLWLPQVPAVGVSASKSVSQTSLHWISTLIL